MDDPLSQSLEIEARLADWAATLWSFQRALVSQGFEREEAQEFCVDANARFLELAMSGDDD